MSRSLELPGYEVEADVRVDPSRTALVIVDMQNDFVRDGGTLQVADAPATIPAISRCSSSRASSGMRVVFSQDTHDPGDPEFEIWPEHARAGTWGWEMIDELAPARRRARRAEGPLRRVLRHRARPHAAAVERQDDRAVRDRREHLRALHSRQRGAALV